MFPLLRLALPIAAVVVAGAQSPRTTMDGVYTAAQATKGRDVFATVCQSCHTPTVHSGPPFRNKWFGRSLGDLFEFLRTEMPKSDPGSLSDDEYVLAIAYLMKINGMPTGRTALAPDSASLYDIRIDSVPPVPPTTGPRR